MPELPEVETVRLQLLHKVRGKSIKKVTVLHPKTVVHEKLFAKKMTEKSISHIDRIGKLLIFSFTHEKDLFLLVHLKMTGQFFYADASGIVGGGHSMSETDLKLPHKHTRAVFHFSDSSVLYFNDMRLFGYIKTATAKEVAVARAKYGQEPISEDFDIDSFVSLIRKRNTTVKAALLDQKFVAGLGNIYVDEALFMAKVRPTRNANTLTKNEARAIAIASSAILKKSIAVGGTTFQHFKDTGGENGNYTDYLQVFGKQKTPCGVCGTEIEKIRVAGRGTHYCPTCQK